MVKKKQIISQLFVREEDDEGYLPEQAYPRRPCLAWRELMVPGEVRYLTREEIDSEYDPVTLVRL